MADDAGGAAPVRSVTGAKQAVPPIPSTANSHTHPRMNVSPGSHMVP